MGTKERKMCFGICGRVIIGREHGCLGGNFGIGRICVGWRGSGERFLGMRRGLGLGGSGFRFLRELFLCIYVFLLVRLYGEDMVSLFLCCFLATNVVIDCFSLFLNFSTYDLIKHHLLEKFPGIREIAVACLKEEKRVSQ